MGAERFPLVSLRKNVLDNYELLRITENITVPTVAPYQIRLHEVPDTGEIQGQPTISGLSRTSNYPPGLGQFYVNFRTGDIVFNVGQAGMNLTVDYYGKGSLVSAEDFNFIFGLFDTHRSDLSAHTPLDDTVISDKFSWSSDRIVKAIELSNTSYTVELAILTSTDISNKFLQFLNVPISLNTISVFVYGGSILMKGKDYNIEMTNNICYLKWDNMPLESLLEENDELIMIYQKKT